jgi:hypothetical protein
MSTVEAPAELNPSGNSPVAQGSNVPLGWKPSREQPVPVVRCVQIKANGERCERWSLRALDKCYTHAGRGNLKNVHERQAAVIESSRLRLVEDTDLAVDVLEALTQPGTAEGIRLKAATEILDRAGVRGGFELDVVVEERESPIEALKDRIAELKKGAAAVEKLKADRESEQDIVDAEVVDDPDEQPSLFDMEPEDES